ncbi:TPA: DUF551 domain-containing protein [Klebsiella pneumoniae]|nr:DUF551 domain-containing protein [Klebsiella pneumoniae]
MTSKLTRERLQEIAEDGFLKHGESKELARTVLAVLDSEPVAEVLSNRPGNDTSTIDRALPVGTQLYRHAQTAPVVNYVPLGDSPYDVPYGMPSNLREFIDQEIGILFSDDDAQGVWIACRRAAMLQAAPACTCPSGDGSLRLPCQVHPGNCTVIPDGWKMVPIDATRAMIDAARRVEEDGYDAMHKAMLAAAPQSPGSEPATVPGKWIPVSERMPEAEGHYLVWANASRIDGYCDHLAIATYQGGEWSNEFNWLVNHWMPLPAAPQEDINALIPLVSRNEQEVK